MRMSSRRERSGGSSMLITLSRKSRSSRKRPALTSSSIFRLVAASTRASKGTSREEPTGLTRRSCSTRSSLTCVPSGQLADLVEQHGAVAGRDEDAGALAGRAGEGAPHVTEQLALEHPFRQRAAVDGHEGRGRARAAGVNGAGDDFLAGAALPGDQHRRAGRCDLVHQRPDLPHRGAGADVVLGPGQQRGAQLPVLFGEPALLERAVDQQHQLVVVERLADVVVGPLAHRLDRRRGRSVRGDDDHLGRGREGARRLEHVDARLGADAEIADGQVVAAAGQQAARGLDRLGHLDHVPRPRQQHLEVLPNGKFVVNDQDARHGMILPRSAA